LVPRFCPRIFNPESVPIRLELQERLALLIAARLRSFLAEGRIIANLVIYRVGGPRKDVQLPAEGRIVQLRYFDARLLLQRAREGGAIV
jgi:hypothetical protein